MGFDWVVCRVSKRVALEKVESTELKQFKNPVQVWATPPSLSYRV